MTFVAFLSDKKKPIKETSTSRMVLRSDKKKPVKEIPKTRMVLRSAKKHIKIDETKNKVQNYQYDMQYYQSFYIDTAQINENLKNRREIIKKLKSEGF